MDELARQLDSLRDEVAPQWDEERNARLYAGVGKLRRRHQRQRVTVGVLGCLGMLVAGGASWQHLHARAGFSVASAVASQQHVPAILRATAQASTASAAPTATAHVTAGQGLWLSDGSLVQVASGTGVLDVLHDEKMQIDLRLLSGAAHFQVVPNKQRHFVVDAGGVQVHVVGTVFDVEHVAERVRVSVTEGKVRVSIANGEAFVAGGETRWFDAHGSVGGVERNEDAEPKVVTPEVTDTQAAEASQARDIKRHVAHREAAAAATASSWRSLSQNGDYEAAYRSLARGADVSNDPAELMDAADATRLSGHPEVAATYLRRVVREHRGSPVAPLAAFTLGRVLLERLGQPSEAAESFATARVLAPQGSLAQDALAREVEALSKAGNAHEAYLRARAYVQTYPNGRRLRAVQLYGGLERE